MIINFQSTINLDDFRFEEINTIEPNNFFVSFSDGGDFWIEFDFDYKLIKGYIEPQCITRDYYQLTLTSIKSFSNIETDLIFTITEDTQKTIINYFNNDFINRLKLDTDVLIDENYGL